MSKSEDSPDSAEGLFLENLGVIRRVAEIVTSRYGLSPDEADDFKSWITLKATEDDYAVLRRHRGESSLKTYLAVIVSRQFHEYRRTRVGRWRPSAAATRLGPLATRLETLVYRDGHTLSEAAEVLRTSQADVPEVPQLARLLAQLPARGSVRPVEESLAEAASAATPEQPDTAITEADALRKRVQVHDALARVLADLSPEDLVITRLHFSKGLSLGDVARVLGLPQKPLYRRVERLRLTLRQHLESEGVDESIVQEELANGIDG